MTGKIRGTLFALGLLCTLPLRAQTSVEGTWAGELEVAPGNTITVLFELSREEGQWRAVLNSPDMGAIKNIVASEVGFSDNRLDIEVEALSGSYSGTLAGGSFDGEWTQPGSTIPMQLEPYRAATLSEESAAFLLGQWHGKLLAPGITFNIVFHFERDEEGNFSGGIQNADIGPARQAMEGISLEDGKLFFRVPAANAEYNGVVEGETVTGALTQGGREIPLNVEKGEYVAEIPQLGLSDADYDSLAGSWRGTLGPLTLVLRVERNEAGTIVAFIDSPTQGATGLKVTTATLEDGHLAIGLTVPPARYEGSLAGDTIEGNWTQGGMSNPLTLTRE